MKNIFTIIFSSSSYIYSYNFINFKMIVRQTNGQFWCSWLWDSIPTIYFLKATNSIELLTQRWFFINSEINANNNSCHSTSYYPAPYNLFNCFRTSKPLTIRSRKILPFRVRVWSLQIRTTTIFSSILFISSDFFSFRCWNCASTPSYSRNTIEAYYCW